MNRPATPIRLRVWLLGLSPLVLVAAGLAWALLGRGPKDARPAVAIAEVPSSVPIEPSPLAAWSAPAATPALAAPSAAPIASIPKMLPPPDSSGFSALGEPPEPIAELDAFSNRPPGSERWSAEEKAAYRQKLFDDVDARERSLEAEIRAARRMGDTATLEKKTATLAYLRTRTDDIRRLMDRASRPDSGS